MKTSGVITGQIVLAGFEVGIESLPTSFGGGARYK